MTPEKNQDSKTEEYTDSELFEISMANVTNNAHWDLCDVIISTPMVASYVLKRKKDLAPYSINPKVVAFDEIDLLVNQPEIWKNVIEVMRLFGTKRGKFASENEKR